MSLHWRRRKRALPEPVVIGLNAVITAVTEGVPRFLAVTAAEPSGDARLNALPYGPFDPERDRTLELGLRRSVREKTGLDIGYVEQLYTFGNRNRDPGERSGGPRVISVAYLALVREAPPSQSKAAVWSDWYRHFPWEDWRAGRPAVIDRRIAPALGRWVRRAAHEEARRERQERCDIYFGLHGAPWVAERVLDRYELLYEVGLAVEAQLDRRPARAAPSALRAGAPADLGRSMAFDHRRILATALGRVRGKLKYRPVVFELMPPEFTLLELQQTVEAISGTLLHKQNFRRLVEHGGLVEPTGNVSTETGGRPAKLYRFRREVVLERPAPGLRVKAGRA